MTQQNNNGSSQPQGFAGFDDLISDFSEDLAIPSKAKPVSLSPSAPIVSHSEPATTPPPTSPKSNEPPKTTPAEQTKTTPVQPHVSAKPEVRVMVEPKPVASSLPQAPASGSQKAMWFYAFCGMIFLIWIFSSHDKSQMSPESLSIKTTQSNSAINLSTTITGSDPTHKPTTPSVTNTPQSSYSDPKVRDSQPVVISKPSVPKVEPDPLVRNIQMKLLSLGYAPGSVDGYIGQKTLKAIRQFQKENKLPIDSKISEQLLSNLDHGQPHVIPQRHQESPPVRSIKNDKINSICPKGKICVTHSKESVLSGSNNEQSSPQDDSYQYNKPDYNNSYISPAKVPNSSSYNNRKTKIVCPTAIFCYPQPIE